jgi:hypothetical protein
MNDYGGRAPRRAEDVKVDPVLSPGWVSAVGHVPEPGEQVVCSEGQAEVVRVLGRTNGGRLLELKLGDRKAPFFASSGNVLVRSAEPS